MADSLAETITASPYPNFAGPYFVNIYLEDKQFGSVEEDLMFFPGVDGQPSIIYEASEARPRAVVLDRLNRYAECLIAEVMPGRRMPTEMSVGETIRIIKQLQEEKNTQQRIIPEPFTDESTLPYICGERVTRAMAEAVVLHYVRRGRKLAREIRAVEDDVHSRTRVIRNAGVIGSTIAAIILAKTFGPIEAVPAAVFGAGVFVIARNIDKRYIAEHVSEDDRNELACITEVVRPDSNLTITFHSPRQFDPISS